MTESAHALRPGAVVRTLVALTRGDRVEHLNRLAARHPHGALLRLPTGRVLVATHPDVTKHVLVDHPDRYIKGMGQLHARQILGDGLLTAEGGTWQEQRTSVRPYLRARAVHERLADVVEAAHAGADALAAADGRPVDLTALLAQYTLTCLARTFGFAPPDGRRVHRAFDVVQDEAIFRAVTQGAVPLRLRPRRAAVLAGALADLRSEAHAALGGTAVAGGPAWAGDEGMLSLFLAGYETTASTLAWAAGYVAHDEPLQDDLAAQGALLARGATPTPADLAGLTWADAVLAETLRLRPPVWLISRRAVAPDHVSGVRLRPGDEVLLLPGAAAEDRSFEPRRAAADPQGRRGLEFGAGPRSCPGVALAHAEAVIWLSVVAARVRLRPVPGPPARPLARMSQAPAGGTVVAVAARTRTDRVPATREDHP